MFHRAICQKCGYEENERCFCCASEGQIYCQPCYTKMIEEEAYRRGFEEAKKFYEQTKKRRNDV